MGKRRLPGLLVAVLLLVLVQASTASRAPRNVVVLIGDGMGFAQTSIARLSLGSPTAALRMDSMRYAGFAKTQSAGPGPGRGAITDSAAAATALACGVKTTNGMLGVLPDGTPVRSILEAAAATGKSTGLVTTVTITHATPAGFGAHVRSRGDEGDIASQYLQQRIDVLLGGGLAYFEARARPGSKRTDDRDLIAEAKSQGYSLVRTGDELRSAAGTRLLGLFADGYMASKDPEPTLADMAAKSLEVLARNRKGFFLMVEGGQIDSFCHGNDIDRAIEQTMGFDEAVGVVLDFARERGDTLVIVTADHETGGLAIVGPASGSSAEYQAAWGTKGHSATVVPLLADGPGAELFSGVVDNTNIPRRIAALWRIRLSPAAGEP